MNKGRLFILSAPSGTGKTTILKRVMAEVEGVSFSVSHATRKPREGEVNGVDYHFVKRTEFLEMKEQGLFLECAEVHGNFYGTSRAAVRTVMERGDDVILDIDVQGARIVRESGGVEATYIFLAPPGLDELERRLRGRGLDDEETIALRLKNGKKELEALTEYEYLIVNDNVEEASTMLASIILAERSKSFRMMNGKAVSRDIVHL